MAPQFRCKVIVGAGKSTFHAMKKLLLVAFCCGVVIITCLLLIRNTRSISHRPDNSVGGRPQGGSSQRVSADRVNLRRSPKPREPGEQSVKIVIPSNKASASMFEKQVADDVAKGDRTVWLHTFNNLLDLSVPRDEAVRIAKGYLNHPEPIIRYEAARLLYFIGDRSGAQTLIQLVLAPQWIAIPGVETDLRAWAASTLASYRDTRGTSAVAALYFANPDDLDLLGYAANLGAQQIVPEMVADLKKNDLRVGLVQYAQLGVVEAKPLAEEQFHNESARVEMRVAAAGAMLRFGEREPYVGYLLDIADHYAAGDLVRGTDLAVAGQNAFQSLSLVHSVEVQDLLERALDSKNAIVDEHALVALNLDYPESNKGRDRLLQSLIGKGQFSANTVFRLAAMSADNEIRTAAAHRDDSLWQRAALHEKNWDKQVWLRNLGVR